MSRLASNHRHSRRRAGWLAALWLSAAWLPGQGGLNKVGTASMLFLKLPVGARAVALGGASSSSYGNAYTVFANPASIALGGDKRRLGLSYTSWLLGIHHQAAAYQQRIGRSTFLAVHTVSLVSGQMEVTTTRQQNGTGDTFRFQDLALGISGARRFSDRLALGITGKLLYESAYSAQAWGFAMDIGTWYWVGARNMRLTMALRNFGPEIRYGGSYQDTHVKGNLRRQETYSYGSFPLPLSFVLGVAGDLVQAQGYTLELALEALHPNDYRPKLHLGLQLRAVNKSWLGLGYKVNYEQESFTAGFGLDMAGWSFGYGYQPMQSFSDIHTVSVGFAVR